MKDEILAGLKIALGNGENLDKAMQSFINAGYNQAEVEAAGKLLSSGGASNIIYSVPEEKVAKKEPEKKFGKKKIWLIVGIAAAALGFLGAVIYLVYYLPE